jgi:hypothetical protein
MSFPKKGKSFPRRRGDGNNLDDQAFAMKIASALQSELKDHNSRAKLVAGWTGAHERTVKNWIWADTPLAADTLWYWRSTQMRS